MDGVFDLINLIFLAVAVAVLLRLRSVLGRRSGHERPPDTTLFSSGAEKNVKDAPSNVAESAPQLSRQESEKLSPVQRGLREISLADQSFHAEQFLEGARIAYEQIISDFAAGNRERLQDLLGEEAFHRFDGVIQEREQRGESANCELITMHDAVITDANMRGLHARITVHFQSELISFVRDSHNRVVDGDSEHLHRAEDVWTFERNTRESNPNWRLVKTSSV